MKLSIRCYVNKEDSQDIKNLISKYSVFRCKERFHKDEFPHLRPDVKRFDYMFEIWFEKIEDMKGLYDEIIETIEIIGGMTDWHKCLDIDDEQENQPCIPIESHVKMVYK